MQSVFKLPIAIEVLRQVDAKKLDLARVVALGPSDRRDGPPGTMAVPAKKTIRELLEAMLTTSDNVACDKLLALVGGPGVVDARVRALGVDHVTIRYTELDLHTGKVDNTATPAAMVALLAKIARRDVGLSAASAALLEDVSAGDDRPAAHPGRAAARDARRAQDRHVRHARRQDRRDQRRRADHVPNGNRVAVAAFVHASPADIATRERAIARLARAAYDAFDAPVGAAALARRGPGAAAAPPVRRADQLLRQDGRLPRRRGANAAREGRPRRRPAEARGHVDGDRPSPRGRLRAGGAGAARRQGPHLLRDRRSGDAHARRRAGRPARDLARRMEGGQGDQRPSRRRRTGGSRLHPPRHGPRPQRQGPALHDGDRVVLSEWLAGGPPNSRSSSSRAGLRSIFER